MKKRIILVIAIIIISVFSVNLSANTYYPGWEAYDYNGWEFVTNYHHMGQKSTEFKYVNNSANAPITAISFNQDIMDGVALWNPDVTPHIVFQNNIYSGNIISTYRDNNTIAGVAQSSSSPSGWNDPVNHTTDWEIDLNLEKYPQLTTHCKIQTCAHEIGHVYGLGHSDISTDIMHQYVSDDSALGDIELMGMDVCTHDHYLSDHTYGTPYYDPPLGIWTSYHLKQCTECKIIKQELHVWPNDYCNDMCSICNDPATRCWTSHSMGSWTNYNNPTQHRRSCAHICSYKEYQNHNYTTPATCTSAAKCGCGASDPNHPALGHNSVWAYNTSITHKYYCTRCQTVFSTSDHYLTGIVGYQDYHTGYCPGCQSNVTQSHTLPCSICEYGGSSSGK